MKVKAASTFWTEQHQEPKEEQSQGCCADTWHESDGGEWEAGYSPEGAG